MTFDSRQIGPEVETERRLALLANGYNPLPLTQPYGAVADNGLLGSKAPVLKGWHKIDYSDPGIEKRVRSWERHGVPYRYNEDCSMQRIPSRTTGIQAPCVIDVDVDDEVAAKVIMDVIAQALGPDFGACPVRTGKGHKFCVVIGTKDREESRSPGRNFLSPDGETKGCVEYFYNKGQIGVSGVHSYHVDADGRVGDPAIVYDWFEGPTPFDTPRNKLPRIAKTKVQHIIMFCNDALTELGWTKMPSDRGGGGGGGGGTSYTLPIAVSEGLSAGDRLAMGEIIGEGVNETRGWAFETERNGETFIGVYDHKTQISYLPEGARPKPHNEVVAAQAAMLNDIWARQRAREPRLKRETRRAPVKFNTNEKD